MGAMPQDELAEIDLTEDEIDAMMAQGEAVELTGPPSLDHPVEFEVIKSGVDTYVWRIVDPSGAILATSDNHYRSVGAAIRAIGALRRSLRNATFRNIQDSA